MARSKSEVSSGILATLAANSRAAYHCAHIERSLSLSSFTTDRSASISNIGWTNLYRRATHWASGTVKGASSWRRLNFCTANIAGVASRGISSSHNDPRLHGVLNVFSEVCLLKLLRYAASFFCTALNPGPCVANPFLLTSSSTAFCTCFATQSGCSRYVSTISCWICSVILGPPAMG